MSARVTALADLTDGDLVRWKDLAASAIEPNVFFEPEFVLSAGRGLHGKRKGLLIVENDDRWVGCVPVQRLYRWRRVPVPVLASWTHEYAFLGTPLIDRDCVAAAVSELVAEGRKAARGLLALGRVGADGPIWSALEGIAMSRPRTRHIQFERIERAALVRRPEATYLENMKPHRRRELNRQARGLEKALGGELVLRERADDSAAYDDFLRLEASGWKGREGTALASDAGHSAFFRSICEDYARMDRLQLLDLSVAGHIVAMKCNFLAGEVVFCFKIAYDEQYGHYSPGLLLERWMIEIFHARPEVSAMDSCADSDNQMINRLWPDRRSIETIVFPSDGAVGWVSGRGFRVALTAHEMRRRVT
jgi:CelD/BcsL family acetyltransferase involved in cellulose biosynthesis